jgi:hypothetical protein
MTNKQNKQGKCDIVAFAIYIKMYLKAKVELWKLKYFTMPKYNLQKNPLKKNPKSLKYCNSI